MSNVILGIIGVILFIGLALSGAVYYGPRVMDMRIQADAANYLSQQSQIAHAVEQYSSDHGSLPVSGGQQPVDVLLAGKYIKTKPPGGSAPWMMNTPTNAIVTPVQGDTARGLKVCQAARKTAGMADPDRVYKCDGSDYPGGRLLNRDPCCVM